MNRARVFIAMVMSIGVAAGAVSSGRADDLLDRILRILGVSATPTQMKSESDVSAGQIWIADTEHGTRSALTTDFDYRWPVYAAGGESIVALRGDRLVRISVKSRKVQVLHNIPGVEKLVGFDRKDPDKLLLVLEKDTAPLSLLSLETGDLTSLPYDPRSKEHRKMLSHIKGQERVYGAVRVYVKTESKRGMEGGLDWSDVYLQQDEAAPRNISKGDGVSCSQPSLSPDGKAVVYVRAGG